MSRYVVTGATSFIGKAVVNELLSQGHQVYVIVRPSSTQKDYFQHMKNCQIVLSEMGNVSFWGRYIQVADYFIHFGWEGVGAEGRSNSDIQRENIKITLKCIEEAGRLGCKKFLFAGSQAEYGIKKDIICENTPCDPIIEYGKAKLEVWNQGSVLAKNLGIIYYHARIFSVYGAGDHPWTLVSTCIYNFLNGQEMRTSSGEQLWNYMYIDDVAKTLVKLMESSAESGIYNIASEDTRPLKSFIKEIYECCGKQGDLLLGTFDPLEKPNNLNPDITKLKKVIGKIPKTDFYEGIKETIRCRKNEDM